MMATFVFDLGLGALTFLAFALLALTQFPHRRATGVPELPRNRALRAYLAAAMLLGMTLVLSVENDGGGFGFLLWASLLSLAACAVALVLGWWPWLLSPLARRMM